MKHGISELEWNDYLDGRATAEARDRIEAHFIGCLECWEFYQKLKCVTQELQGAGEEARQELTLEDRQLRAMLQGVFRRIRACEARAAVQEQVRGRLHQLEAVLAPFCGTRAAASALRSAAKKSPARSLEQVTPDNWEPFLKELTAIAAAMCGESFAGLVQERGRI